MANHSRWIATTCIALSALGSGCYPNRSVLQPWTEAPSSPQHSWVAPQKARSKHGPFPLEVPQDGQPLTLAEILNIALANNTQTQISWAQARQAAAQYAETQSAYFPQIDGMMYYERAKSPSFSTTPFTTGTTSASTFPEQQVGVVAPFSNAFFSQWGPQLMLSYTIWDFGQRRATTETARQTLYFADWTHNRAIQTLIQTITTDYYSFVYQKQLLDALASDVMTAQVTLDSATLGLDTGIKNVSDVLQAKTQLLQKQTQWNSQRQNVKDAYALLISDMGLPSSMQFEMVGLPIVNPQDADLASVDSLIEKALDTRPDLLAAEADLRSKQAFVKSTWTQFLPSLDYSFQFGRTYFKANGHTFNDNYDFTSFIALNIPLFSGFSTLNALRKAKAQQKQSEATLQQVQINVIKDVVTSHYGVKVAFDTLKYAHSFLEAAKKQYDVSLNQYKSGVNNIIDVISAQSALADARATLANALKGWFSSLATLSYATGVLSENQKEMP